MHRVTRLRWCRTGSVVLLLCAVLCAESGRAQGGAAGAGAPVGLILSIEPPTNHTVRVLLRGTTNWFGGSVNLPLRPGDLLETGERCRVLLRFGDRITLPVDQNTRLRIEGLPGRKPGVGLLQGILNFFHRGAPEDFDATTPTIGALIRGTEFQLAVSADGTTTLNLFDGAVEMTNAFGQLSLHGQEAALVPPGQPPRRAPFIEAATALQWRLYYPAVLDVEELRLTPSHAALLRSTLTSYRAGDLLGALANYPPERPSGSGDEQLLHAALLLAIGRVDAAETELDALTATFGADERLHTLVDALRVLIATVKYPSSAPESAVTNPLSRHAAAPELERRHVKATALLAASYSYQARGALESARALARRAVETSPHFGFAWARLAELEFSFGRVSAAEDAVAEALERSPLHAQAIALRGYLLAARNETRQAADTFAQALALEGGLGHAWLGRGLCRIRLGEVEEGLKDLQVAATLEPQRASLRSYLGKAFAQMGDAAHAAQELALAKQLDAQDPTPWLYSALLRQQQNRLNEAVRDLEASQARNDNRSLFRSRLLLDSDQSVRGANLASIYGDVGMREVSQREAVRAVNLDYANYSAHLFLADSYQELRDSRQVNLRYESPWLSEYLVASLLAPPGAGTLSPLVSEQEYSRLFERDRFGLASRTEYWGNGDWYESAVQYGQSGNFAYALEGFYRFDNGHRPNNELEQTSATIRFKQQVTPDDTLLLLGSWYEGTGGDVRPVYNEAVTNLNLSLHTREVQEPLLLAGWQHQWSPGSRTLLLGGWVRDTFTAQTSDQFSYLLVRDNNGRIISTQPGGVGQDYRTETWTSTAELQQIFQPSSAKHTVLLGARYQTGEFETKNTNGIVPQSFVNDDGTPADANLSTNFLQRVSPRFQRGSLYAYEHWSVLDSLLLIGGLSFDALRYPQNFRYAPVNARENEIGRVLPKAGLIWTPHPTTTARFGYSQSLGGVALDRSFQLEPSQIAGFVQSYRSLIPEAVAGANAAPLFQTFGLALDQKFPTGTYVGGSAEWLESEVRRRVGSYELTFPGAGLSAYEVTSLRERLDFRERSVGLTFDQLMGREWAFGARYRVSLADLEDNFSDIPATAATADGFRPRQSLSALLQQVHLHLLYTHPSGFFGQFESILNSQNNDGYRPSLPGDTFWQLNLWAGWRFWQRRVEARVGVLNLTDRDYHLNPLNNTMELPHERTFYSSVKLSF